MIVFNAKRNIKPPVRRIKCKQNIALMSGSLRVKWGVNEAK
jgi:hypothetical protein